MTDKELLNQFMPWICKWANKCQYISKYIDFDDLQSVGMMAVFEGRDGFKEGKNTKLSTYIMNMVKFRILRHANSGKEYSLSQNNHIMGIQKARRILGDRATAEEISEWMKSHYSDRASMLSPSAIKDLEQVAAIKHFSIQAKQETEGTQPDRYMPAVVPDFEGDLDRKMRIEKLYENIEELKGKASYIMKARLRSKSLVEIGTELNLSQERIRQIEAKSIHLLRRMNSGTFIRKTQYKVGEKNENHSTDCKRNANRGCRRGIRHLRDASRKESFIDAGSTSHISGARRETHKEPEIKKRQKGTDNKIEPGQIVCNGQYKITDIVIPDLSYEVLILDTGKHTVLKTSEIY